MARASRESEARRAVADGRLCLCTPYNPSAGFSVANAMGRNKLIYALSQATFVVAADLDRGGTWAGAVEALRQGSAPVLVWTGEGAGEGNRRLVDLGGLCVERISELFPLPVLGRSDASASPRLARKRLEPPEPAPEQLALDV